MPSGLIEQKERMRARRDVEGDFLEGGTKIIPMACETFLKRAETRMLNLYARLLEVPLLREAGLNADEFVADPAPRQGGLELLV